MAVYAPEFAKGGVKLLGLSCDDFDSHVEWIKDIEAYMPGSKVTYSIVADKNRKAIKQLNMVDPDEQDFNGGTVPSRVLHIVGSDKKIKLSFLYPASTERNVEEVMRRKIATPANWKPGDAVVISPNVSNEDAKKEYLRFTNGD
ncbi:hypothetical protein K2173_011400 [Erythroxylum novogranatense]|uniref:thioredoxin-dependent peroxiredoxin n=1 Tax=Erythroxylum novogranatense TaxID=1862640 RepID=A0AAV8S4Q1_9ROSI|nr:hypothetical protein K2173_011400 [Erythroxylum novogranatense]